MNITVEYPTVETKQVLRKKDSVFNPWHPENNQDRMVTISTPVNQEEKVYVMVKATARLVQEEFMDNDDYSTEQTGMKAAQYQRTHGRAFNE